MTWINIANKYILQYIQPYIHSDLYTKQQITCSFLRGFIGVENNTILIQLYMDVIMHIKGLLISNCY